MRKEIARVKLTSGNGGYFDPITRIHLTHGDPEKPVYSGMNVSGLQAAVRSRRISVVSGSLGEFVPPFKLIRNSTGKVVLAPNTVKTKVKPATKKAKVEKSTPFPVEEEIKEEPVVVEKIEETPVEQPISNPFIVEEEISAIQEETDPEIVTAEQEVEETVEETNATEETKKNKKKKKK